MIPIHSLRKGIKVMARGKVGIVKYFDETQIFFENLEPCSQEEITGIPISEYWLQMFFFIDEGFHKNPDRWIGHSQNRGLVYFLHGPQQGQLLTTKGNPLTLYPVQFIHQFQNALYYFFGREADYKIPAEGIKVYENGKYVQNPI